MNKDKNPDQPVDPKTDEVAPAVENFTDSDNNQVVNTANDVFDEAQSGSEGKSTVKEKVLPPGSTDMLDDGAQPALNKDDKSL